MTQRAPFWSRHGSSSSDRRNDGDKDHSSRSKDTQSSTAASPPRVPITTTASSMQPRLPRNSGSPSAAAASFSSHYSSSPSPSPSINPFAGALRTVSEATAVSAGGRARGATVGTMPANIRRSEGTRQQSQVQPQQQQQRPLARSSSSSAGGRDARCEQIVQSFYSKAAQVVGQLRGATAHGSRRLGRSSGYGSGPGASDWAANISSTSSSAADGRQRANRWFNLCLDDLSEIRDEVAVWRQAVLLQTAVPPMFIDVCLDVSRVADGALQLTDIFGRAWTVDLDGVGGRASSVVVETWRLDLDTRAGAATDLPRVYKQAIVFFRSLYAFASLMPATALARAVAQRTDGALSMFCVFRADSAPRPGTLALDAALTGTERFLEAHAFAPVATPLGSFAMHVQYRRECRFDVAPMHDSLDDAVAALDDAYFAPTLSPRSADPHVQQRVAVPSVNPFRARPLSLGESSLPTMAASSRAAARRVSLGTRSVAASEPTHADGASPGATLHRSAMRRLVGDVRSPGEQTAGDSSSIRSTSSGSAGSGVAPFRSPSLSSPGAWHGRSLAEPGFLARAESLDVGSATSSRSRGLASSFGNRRTSAARRTSMLGAASLPRREADDGIADFIRMVDSRQPLRVARATRTDGGRLDAFHGALNEFTGLSRDVMGSVTLGRAVQSSATSSAAAGLRTERPMPNPLRTLGASAGGDNDRRLHVREAAAGRDALREPVLPSPVNIPGTRRGAQRRGWSQPAADAADVVGAGFLPRLATPQPHVLSGRSPEARQDVQTVHIQQTVSQSPPSRPNFPPLSFIVPRARVEQARSNEGRADADDDLMFQMDGSLH